MALRLAKGDDLTGFSPAARAFVARLKS